MPTTLRLIQTSGAQPGTFGVQVELDRDGRRRTVQAVVTPGLTEVERNEIRWYMEDYLEHPFDPYPEIADRIEGRMAEAGRTLFKDIFQANQAASDFWARVRDDLQETRVEISTNVRDAAAIPWELLRDPATDQPLALDAREFVRVQSETAREAPAPDQEQKGPVRVLLVICRPAGRRDVPFRSVASRLVKGLTDQGRDRVQLDLLRPPTYERLGRVLEAAKEAGRPYHVVHFDGHGIYADQEQLAEIVEDANGFNPHRLDAAGTGAHGYLAFEKADGTAGIKAVGGTDLGALLRRCGVPVLVLNACRSAHAEHNEEDAQPAAATENAELVRAYGSLAQEVVDQGVAGVVAMRYNVYVVTAAQFVAELYDSLASGRSLGRAVARARRNLAQNPARHVYEDPIDLQDWPVPVVYEAAPIHLFPKAAGDGPAFRISAAATAPAGEGEGGLPKPPDTGFFGRDGTLLDIERAFDRHNIVLLHAFAGSGKTATAAEFARWYRDTGGLGEGAILFDSFQSVTTVKGLLDKLGGLFDPLLAANGIQWLSLDEATRRRLALDILRRVPVLWIWDNMEPVAGFPAGAPSSWTPAEQKELADFLRDLKGTRARVLLTSRRDEKGWLGQVPVRVPLPPMPGRERRQLAEELIRRHNKDASLVKVLGPLLDFSEGNPMTLAVTVGQALRDGLASEEAVEAYVARLRAGEAEFDDSEEEGRDRSLGASLKYGFDQAFTPADRCRLALLHLFQGFVDVDALRLMGDAGDPARLPTVADLTREEGMDLLDRAAEIGLLTAHGAGYYSLHPALPWFLKGLFDRCHGEAGDAPARAYAMAVGQLGSFYQQRFIVGHHEVLGHLQAEEQNLLQACRLARAHDWFGQLLRAMQGLNRLYVTAGRWAGWQALVDEAIPLVTAADDAPRPGREEEWGVVMGYRVELAEQRHDGAEVLRLLRQGIEVQRPQAPRLRARPAEDLDWDERNTLRSLAGSLQKLGTALAEQGDPEAVPALEEARELCRHIGDRPAEAIAAFNLGHAYLDIPAIRDLDQAEGWYQASLDLRDDHDRTGRAACHGQLGQVALKRFDALRATPDPDRDEALRHLQAAEAGYRKALDLTPDTALAELAVGHSMLALVYDRADEVDAATRHYQKAISFREKAGDRFGAGQSRFNLAMLLARNGKPLDALAFARAARADFASYGPHGAADLADADRLIAAIEEDLAATPPSP